MEPESPKLLEEPSKKQLLINKIKTVLGNRFVQAVIFVLVGLLIGLAIGCARWGDTDTPTTTRTKTSSPQSFENRLQAYSDQRVQQVEQQVDKELATKMISQDQADAIKAKLVEVKKQSKTIDRTTKEGREQLHQLREDLKKWSTENNIPSRYIIFLY